MKAIVIMVLDVSIVFALLIAGIIVLMPDALSQEVKYCKNYTTGEIVVVEKGMPCPYPTAEL